MLYEATMNTSAFGVQRSMKGLATVKELVVFKVARVVCKISLNRKHPSKKFFMPPKGARVTAGKMSFLAVIRALSLERRLNQSFYGEVFYMIWQVLLIKTFSESY